MKDAASLDAWTAPDFPVIEAIEGRFCRLERLDPARHSQDLWEALRDAPQVWTYLPRPEPVDAASYRGQLDEMAARADIVPLAIVDKADGKAKGHLWLMEIRPEHGVAEVGFVTFSPSLQRTAAATEAIFLCAAHLFERGYRRFEWKCDSANERSKLAAARFGFIYEGTFRQHMVVKGRNRDTCWFAILDRDWPDRKRAFESWLSPDNFDANGHQRRSLAELRAGGA